MRMKLPLQKLGSYKYAIGVLAIGLFLMLLPSSSAEESPPMPHDSFDRAAVQREMETILSAVEGTGKLSLMLSVESGAELELAGDMKLQREESKSSQEKKTLVLDCGSSESVVVTKSRYPRFTGALIVCEGAGKASVRLALTQAVASLTGLTADRITVVKGKP